MPTTFNTPARLSTLFATLLLASNIHAITLGPWQAAAALGMALPFKAGNSSITNNGPYPADAYSADNPSGLLTLDIAALRAFTLKNHINQVGVHYNMSRSQTVSGSIDEFGLAGFNNYTYQYTIARQSLLVSYEWGILTRNEQWQPYVLAGLGLSLNKASGYSQTPVAGLTPVNTSPAYTPKTSIQPTFELGAGVRYHINALWQVNAEYQYLNAGKAELGTGIYGSSTLGQTVQYNMFLLGVSRQF